MERGLLAAIAAFSIWGLVPLFWRLLAGVSVAEIAAHRVVFGCIAAAGWLVAREGVSAARNVLSSRRTAAMLFVSSVLVATNGGIYVYGVNSGQVVATSLGYFINPLLNVALGVVVLGESLSTRGRLSVVLAAVGVAYMSLRAGSLPWISLVLAGSFASYGMVRKTIAIEALPGLAIETTILFPFALAYLLYVEATGGGAFVHAGLGTSVLLATTGPLTAIPLVLFAYGARRIPYSTVGIIQFIGPSLQLACAVFVFDEPFTDVHAVGFGFIWAALAIYAIDGFLRRKVETEATTTNAPSTITNHSPNRS